MVIVLTFMSNIIEIREGKILQKGNPVLRDVNVEIRSDEFVYLIGKTGSGKSSLLKTLYGELRLSEGTGSVAGFDLVSLMDGGTTGYVLLDC